MGACITPEVLRAFDSLEGFSLKKVVVPVSLEQNFKAIKELDFAAETGRELSGPENDPETRLRGANILTITARGRALVVKQLRDIAKDLPSADQAKQHKNLPPVLIHQSFNSVQPEKVAVSTS